jgi:tetratricopeptide (TPR) repeat protein
MADATVAARTATELVGREQELAALEQGLLEARAGQGALFLVGGEPGIGKSRLADEFARHARSSGARVAWGRCWEGAGAPAYWPWIQVLRAHFRGLKPEIARQQLGIGAPDVAQILPEIRDLLPDLEPPPADSESARFQLFDSTASLLRNLAAERETVVILEDLHAGDTPSILLLRFVASQLSDMRLVVLGTYRDIALAEDHPLFGALTELAREPSSRRLTLSGLREEGVRLYIEATAGIQPSARMARHLWRETSGNPLFLGEAVRLLQSERRFEEALVGETIRLAVPAGLRDVIARRVSQLDRPIVKALTIGAALGPEFSTDVLRRVGRYRPADVMKLLDQAVRAGFLAPVTASRSGFRFSHDLVREYLYQEQLPADRVRVHLQIGAALEQMYGPSADAHLAELAHHYFEAASGGGDDDDADAAATIEKARDYSTRAGGLAVKSLAYEEAARLFRMALAMMNLEPLADDGLRTELLLAIGDADARAGDMESANTAFLEAADIARRTGAARHLASAALGLGGRLPWARAGNNPHLIPFLEEALVLLGGEDEKLRVRLLGRLACAWRSSPEKRQQSDTFSRQAIEIARRLDDPATLSYALVARWWATFWPENPADRLPLAREMLGVAERARDGERMSDGRAMLWMNYTELRRMDDAAHELDELRRLAEELRQPAHLWLGQASPTLVALMEGDFAEAERLIERELQPGPPSVLAGDNVSAAASHSFLLTREQGRAGDVEQQVRAAAAAFPWYPVHRAALALILIELGREGEARAAVAELARDEFKAFYRDNEWLLGMSLSAEASFLLNDTDAAIVLYEQLAGFSGAHAVAYAEGSVGVVDRYLGLLAATLGRLDDAERHLDDAIRLNRQIRAWPWAAHSLADLAVLLRRRNKSGDVERAGELDRDALATARELGMVALERKVTERAGEDLAASPTAGAAAEEAIFRREGEYWTVAYGPDGFRLRDTKGLRYLARLLMAPGREFLALELAQEEVSAPPTNRPAADADLRSRELTDAGAQLDQEAKQAYRTRLHELQEELDEAETWNDPGRAERAREEMDFLRRELARAVGLGGRDRPSGSPSERARLSVTRAIRLAMGRIADHSSSLGDHLATTIHTGTYCAYRPDSRVPVEWRQ